MTPTLSPAALHMFRRGVVVAASIIVGLQTALFGGWLLLSYDTFATSQAYGVMQTWFGEEVWGTGFLIGGGSVFFCGMTLWVKLADAQPVPLWLRAVTATLLLGKLLLVVVIFYLASVESPAAPLFSVMLASVAVLLLSALDELNAYERVARLWHTNIARQVR